MAKEIKLSEFLKENDAYNRFINNFKKEFEFTSSSESLSIYNSFSWDATIEGWIFWDMLDTKWDYLEDNLKIYDMDWLLEKGENK